MSLIPSIEFNVELINAASLSIKSKLSPNRFITTDALYPEMVSSILSVRKVLIAKFTPTKPASSS